MWRDYSLRGGGGGAVLTHLFQLERPFTKREREKGRAAAFQAVILELVVEGGRRKKRFNILRTTE